MTVNIFTGYQGNSSATHQINPSFQKIHFLPPQTPHSELTKQAVEIQEKVSFSKDAFGHTCLNFIQNNLLNKHPLGPKIPNKGQSAPFFNLFNPWGMSWVVSEAQTWFGGVFGVIKDQDVAGRSLGGDDAGILGHVTGSVHLSLVVYLDFNFNFSTY